MLLEERRLHMGARSEETSAVHRGGEPVAIRSFLLRTTGINGFN
jgi:hypothetical protein